MHLVRALSGTTPAQSGTDRARSLKFALSQMLELELLMPTNTEVTEYSCNIAQLSNKGFI